MLGRSFLFYFPKVRLGLSAGRWAKIAVVQYLVIRRDISKRSVGSSDFAHRAEKHIRRTTDLVDSFLPFHCSKSAEGTCTQNFGPDGQDAYSSLVDRVLSRLQGPGNFYARSCLRIGHRYPFAARMRRV